MCYGFYQSHSNWFEIHGNFQHFRNACSSVPIFMLITAYFMAKSNRVRVWSAINTLIVYLAALFILQLSLTGNISELQWPGWYLICLIPVLALSPLLNKMMCSLNKWYSLIIGELWIIIYLQKMPASLSFNLIDQYRDIVFLLFYYLVDAWVSLHINVKSKKTILISLGGGS